MFNIVRVYAETKIVRVIEVVDLVELAEGLIAATKPHGLGGRDAVRAAKDQLAPPDRRDAPCLDRPFNFSSAATRSLISLETESIPSFVPRTRSTRRFFSNFRCSSSCRTNEVVCLSSSSTGAIGSPFLCESSIPHGNRVGHPQDRCHS